MKFKCIHVGLGIFSLQRLQINLNNNNFEIVAFVDLDKEKSLERLKKLKNIPSNVESRVFTTITEAKKRYDAEVCFIYASSEVHSNLIIESLNLDMHTLCVKSIACNTDQFKEIMKVKNKKPNLILVQGLNNQFNEASFMMQKILNNKEKFGDFKFGHCLVWGRQNLKSSKPLVDTTQDGIFFHSMGCHQLSQLVSALGLPRTVYSLSPKIYNEELGFVNAERTSGGSCMLEYNNNSVFSYLGTRAAHSNPFGFASRWSGQWLFHGTKGDLKREGGRITLFQNGNIVMDNFFKDLDENLIEDDNQQFKIFYENLNGNKEFDLQKKSLETWILMEACNLSSRSKKEVIINDFIDKLNFLQK